MQQVFYNDTITERNLSKNVTKNANFKVGMTLIRN